MSAAVQGPGLGDVLAEVARIEARWGKQNHADGTGNWRQIRDAETLRKATEAASVGGTLTWRHILAEEVAEAFAESDPVKLREELVQVAAGGAGVGGLLGSKGGRRVIWLRWLLGWRWCGVPVLLPNA